MYWHPAVNNSTRFLIVQSYIHFRLSLTKRPSHHIQRNFILKFSCKWVSWTSKAWIEWATLGNLKKSSSWRLWFLAGGGRNRWTCSQLYPSPDASNRFKDDLFALILSTQNYLTHFLKFPSQNGHHITFNENACQVSWTSKATLSYLKDLTSRRLRLLSMEKQMIISIVCFT